MTLLEDKYMGTEAFIGNVALLPGFLRAVIRARKAMFSYGPLVQAMAISSNATAESVC
jgi:hypothetical protein